jgi:hypothetical protein
MLRGLLAGIVTFFALTILVRTFSSGPWDPIGLLLLVIVAVGVGVLVGSKSRKPTVKA